ncbi:MAG TPA: hypothetical protein VFE47_29285 [Tepidisphaeraceae bacterium]|jgi:hypothetical protein|nr:hypothetical protein [Tepidisphaeraceae bacterium]
MIKVFAAVVLSLIAVGCASRPQYDGSHWPSNQEGKDFHASLKAMADSAISGNDASLRDLFRIKPLFDTERAEYYDWILRSVYRKREKAGFARVLYWEPYYIKVGVLVSLRDDLSDDEMQRLLKETEVELASLDE